MSVLPVRGFFLPATLLMLIAVLPAARADSVTQQVSQTWKMLDYMSADYSGAVAKDGSIISPAEYAEMREFSRAARDHIAKLPDKPGKARLLAQADAFVELIEHKAPHAQVARQAHEVNKQLLALYPIPTAPAQVPDLERGAALYQAQCAACHGATGDGRGPAAAGLEPPPTDFTDLERANQRSALSYFQTLSQGVAGTSMASYGKTLSARDRWALAYYVGTLAYRNDIGAGAPLWRDDTLARAQLGGLAELSDASVNQVAAAIGMDKARALVAYLRAHPAELDTAPTGIALARDRLAASVTAYERGDRANATQLALSAYLDGVEPVEPLLNAHDSALRSRIELEMGAFRTGLSRGTSVASVRGQANTVDRLLAEAQVLTSGTTHSATAVFVGAFTILLREGLEALLVVVAIIAFLKKAGRGEVLPWIHGAWILALVAGGLTWLVARYFIDISGASRELTEGVSSIFAAVVLLGVGLWLHQKSIGNRWQAYIKQKMSQAITRQSAWLLFVLAFVTVYREMFETILFYIALWTDGDGLWMLAGIACAMAALALIAWAMLKTSARLPIHTFFSASSVLIAVLAIVLAGKGISALQEAGWVGVNIAPLPHVDLLGIYPTWQTASAQALTVAVLVAGYLYNRRLARTA